MSILFGLLAVVIAVLMIFLDRIIEYFIPNGNLAHISEETDEIILNADYRRF